MSTKKQTNSKIPHYHVTTGLIRNDDKILIAQRLFNDIFAGLWEFPGGKQKSGETLEQCLVREIDEELDIEIQIDKKVMSVTHKYDHLQITLHVFLCTFHSGTLELKEVQDCKWIEFSELNLYEFTEADQKVIKRLEWKTLV